ncbi:MAG: putative lipid II flippase FtsW [Woeseiaceae bacterium]|nr:putative lipid II flippase FtsW [Woeseiaceae bacterium]
MNTSSIAMPFAGRTAAPVQLDPVLLTMVGLLLCGGMIILASASMSISDSTQNNPFYYLGRQSVAALIGLAAGFACLFVPMRFLSHVGPVLLIIGLAMLLLVLIPGLGHTVNGSTRWLRIGAINLQVSEPVRLFVLIYLAGYLVRKNKTLREHFTGFLWPMVVLSIVCVLLLAEPDFGAAIVLLTTALAMLFVAGARFRDFLIFFGVAVFAMAALAITSPYRLERMTGFLDPWSDPYDSGFQLTQSLIAIGRGEWFGVGLGEGVQKLFYLPEAHTDFVFAVFAEEFGLIGSLLLIGLFLALLARICSLAIRAANSDRFFEAYLAVGIATWLGLQTFINIGVNMGLLPTKGLTLPLVSYGRSSLIVAMTSIGLLLRIHHELQTDTGVRGARRKRTRRKAR